MAPAQATQDQFIDEDAELCPLCIEEFDLSDRQFYPCPCGYQICTFCYNNIKTTLNSLCPACRRPYDEQSMTYVRISLEDMAKHKQQATQKQKKNAAVRQKEAQKAEADTLSRKHLAGLRVVRKNLVYVTGLMPTTREDRLHDILRGSDYFGQYGEILKVAVSKFKDNGQHQQPVAVYVTFAGEDDAAKCIAAVDGSQNNDRTLRAQYGTTKYCSSFLRNEQCTKANCMFLHEPGQACDSFTRQDLSLRNVQTASRAPQPQPPPQQAAQHTLVAPGSLQGSAEASPSPTGEVPALPTGANWGSKTTSGRRSSHSTDASDLSPKDRTAAPVPPDPLALHGDDKERESTVPSAHTFQPKEPGMPFFGDLLERLSKMNPSFLFDFSKHTPEEKEALERYPCLIDPNGGTNRRALKEKETDNQATAELQLPPEIPLDPIPGTRPILDETASGSLQLGGEPEESHEAVHAAQHAIAPPSQQAVAGGLFGQDTAMDDRSNLGHSNLNAQQLQNYFLLKSAAPQTGGPGSSYPSGQLQHSHGQSVLGPSHGRQASRLGFANEPAASMQQASHNFMYKPSQHGQHPQHQPLGGQYLTSGVHGPPPGLKTTGTPPISGGGMFGQGHGFTSSRLGYGNNRANEAMYQDLLRPRGMDVGRAADAKRESMFSFVNHRPTSTTPVPAPGLLNFPYGPSPGAYQETGSQKPKKKGKKHRHANTSSSGGGAVDVPDPSILQARTPGGAMAGGQGLYGVPGQGGYSSLYTNGTYGGSGRW